MSLMGLMGEHEGACEESKECGGSPWTLACSQHTIHLCLYFIPGAFEIEINGQLVFSKLENGGFPYEKDVSICSLGRTLGRPAP